MIFESFEPWSLDGAFNQLGRFVFAGSDAGTKGMSSFHPHMMHSPALAMPSQRELDQLHARLAQEERSLHDLKQHAPMAPPRIEQWRYLPQDGAPMQILLSPSLDGPKSQHVLHPGDIFTVVDTATQAGMTFLRLQDGRGWALQSKPVGSWLSFFGGEPTTLCIPFSGSQAPDPRAGQFSRPSTLSSTLPPERPTVPQTQLRIDAAVPQSGLSNRRSDVVGLLGNTAPGLGESQPKPDSASKAPLLHVRILSANGLRNMDIGSFFGNKSDPYVVVRLGKEHRQTPVIDNNLDPVWTDGRDFTFDFNAAPNLLELEVFNSNMFVDDTLGKTSLSLNGIPTGKWVRKKDQLRGSSAVAPAEGELEYEVLIEGGSEVQHVVQNAPAFNRPSELQGRGAGAMPSSYSKSYYRLAEMNSALHRVLRVWHKTPVTRQGDIHKLCVPDGPTTCLFKPLQDIQPGVYKACRGRLVSLPFLGFLRQ